MNKLEGFYFFREVSIPTVEWQEYTGQALNLNLLWTVRSAVFGGDDFNLPRLVGVTADKATEFAKKIKTQLCDNGKVFVYPFFVAEKSGTLMVNSGSVTIECVLGDLWNLVTYGKPDFSAVYNGETTKFFQGEEVLTQSEIEELINYSEKLKRNFRKQLAEGVTVYTEWSFAFNSSIDKKPVGDRYTVFYELRTIK